MREATRLRSLTRQAVRRSARSLFRETDGLYASLPSPGEVFSLCLSDDGSRLAAAYFRGDPRIGRDLAVAMWDTESGLPTSAALPSWDREITVARLVG